MYYLYILYSLQMKKYYIGSISMLPELRLKQHLLNHKGFTSKEGIGR
ncbi:MAG: GIY-YIG nuclease family protein [Chitinophagaceae bacterium]